MHAAFVKIESTINTYYPISVQCEDCDFSHVADGMAEASESRDLHIYAMCEHENTTTYQTNWSEGDEVVCDDCEKTYNYYEREWIA